MSDTLTAASLAVRDLNKSYPTASQPLRVLRGLTLELSAGQSLAIVGPSGSGKSTLLQILGTLDRPDGEDAAGHRGGGHVRVDGVDPFTMSDRELAAFRNQKIGFIFQDHHLLPQLTVIENVLVPSLATGKPAAEDLQRGQSLLESVGLADRLGHLPGELSGGERERVAVARALLMNPTLILADEPTGNLDRRTAATITELLLDLQQSSGAILVTVTHSEALAAAMQHQKELVDGQLVDR